MAGLMKNPRVRAILMRQHFMQRRRLWSLLAAMLACNAILHGGGGGSLLLTRAEGSVRCRVSDEGPGFASTAARSGGGLWLAEQLTDALEIDGPSQRCVSEQCGACKCVGIGHAAWIVVDDIGCAVWR